MQMGTDDWDDSDMCRAILKETMAYNRMLEKERARGARARAKKKEEMKQRDGTSSVLPDNRRPYQCFGRQDLAQPKAKKAMVGKGALIKEGGGPEASVASAVDTKASSRCKKWCCSGAGGGGGCCGDGRCKRQCVLRPEHLCPHMCQEVIDFEAQGLGELPDYIIRAL